MKPITEEQRQALIADCEEEIRHLKEHILRLSKHHVDFDLSQYESQLQRQEIVLASLTADTIGFINKNVWRDFGQAICTDDFEAYSGSISYFPVYTAPPVPVIKLPDEHSFDAWFKAIEAGDDQVWSEPEYLSKEWHEYLGRRQLALGAYRLSIDETKRLNGMVQ